MFRRLILAITLCLPLVACSDTGQANNVKWHYGAGSNIDELVIARVVFYRNGTLLGGYTGEAWAPGTSSKRISEKRYYWAGGGLPGEMMAVPDQALAEMVSLHDRKRYRISVDLPADLAQQMKQRYEINGDTDQRNWLYFGLAPGGYYEVLLKGDMLRVKPDILLARGIAEEVTDNWYDKKVPLVRQYNIDAFDKKYGELLKQYPVPQGMEWAAVMDSYRAKQPRTDRHPIN